MRRYVWIFMLAFMVTCFVGCEEKNTSVSTESQNSYIQIQMDEAIMMMEEETDYIILDVRTPEEFAEKHIPGAVNVPNESIGTEEIKELPNKDQFWCIVEVETEASRPLKNWWHWDIRMCMSLAALMIGQAKLRVNKK